MTQATPIFIDLAEEQSIDPTTMADVLLGAIGLTGVLIVVAILFGVVMGGLFILWKRRQDARLDGPRAGAETGAVHISPYAS